MRSACALSARILGRLVCQLGLSLLAAFVTPCLVDNELACPQPIERLALLGLRLVETRGNDEALATLALAADEACLDGGTFLGDLRSFLGRLRGGCSGRRRIDRRRRPRDTRGDEKGQRRRAAKQE
jgi:hypothetical protein